MYNHHDQDQIYKKESLPQLEIVSLIVQSRFSDLNEPRPCQLLDATAALVLALLVCQSVSQYVIGPVGLVIRREDGVSEGGNFIISNFN